MRHDPNWATFNSSYINEKVGFHLQNAFLYEPTEDKLLTMLSHIGLMRDPRASKDMVPDEVWELMPSDPEIEALKAERAQLKGGRYRIKDSENEGKIRELTKLIAAKCSVIITPSAPDEAPAGLDDMGSPVFNTLWTVSRRSAVLVSLCSQAHLI